MLYARSMDAIVSSLILGSTIGFSLIDGNLYTNEPLIRLMNVHPRNFLTTWKIDRQYDSCPFIRKGSIAIAWNGNISPCLPLMHQHESYMKKYTPDSERYVVGNIMDQP